MHRLQLKDMESVMRWFSVILVFACMFGRAADEKPLEREKLTYYVSNLGSDENPGGADMPFATLHRARLQIRTLLMAGTLPKNGVRIVLRDETYALDKPFVLSGRDGGTAEAPIEWVGEGNATLSGGVEIPFTAFTDVADTAILERLPENTRVNVCQVDLKAFGIDKIETMPDMWRGAAPFGEVIFRGKPMTLARWPNKGWALTDGVAARGSRAGDSQKEDGVFEYNAQVVPAERWNVAKGIWLQGFWSHDWYDEIFRVKAVDTERKTVKVASAESGYGVGSMLRANTAPRRFRVINCLEELDSEGEWFVDAETCILYCWFPKLLKEEMETGSVFYSRMREPLLQLKGCKNLVIKNIRFANTLGGAIFVNGEGNILEGCRVENTGDFGIDVEGSGNIVRNCVVADTGTYGIGLNGGDLQTLENGGNRLENSLISRIGRWQLSYSPAVKLRGVGNVVTHCEMMDAPHAAIMYAGNEHEISFNDIHHVCQETSDAGALYTTRNWGSWGNILRHNKIHDIAGLDGWCMGVYLDDCDSGDTIIGNIFANVATAVFIGGGRNNIVRNTIFINCPTALYMDERGRENVKWNTGDTDGWDLEAKLKAVGYQRAPWSKRYPQLAKIMQDRPEWPLYNEACCNVVAGGTGFVMKEALKPLLKTEDNWFTDEESAADNIDWARIDLSLRNLQAIRARIPAFEEIPLRQIGRLATKKK